MIRGALIGAAAAAFLGASSFARADIGTSQLPQLFVSACLDGKAELSRSDATPAKFSDLPRDLQQRLSRPSSAQIWRLESPGTAYLYVLDYGSRSEANPRICGVASDEMDYSSAADTVEKRVMGQVYPRTASRIEWTDAHGGYTAMATTAGKFTLIQVKILSAAQQAAALKDWNFIKP